MRESERTFRSWVQPPPIAGRLWLAVAGSAAYAAGVWAVRDSVSGPPPAWAAQLAVVNTAVLSLLISFRTKVAYDRWWEGRVLWAQLVNHARNLCLKARALVELDAAERRALADLVAAFPVALARHLRGPGRTGGNAEPARAAGRLMAVTAGWRAGGRVDGHTLRAFDAHTAALMDVCGGCERVRDTPPPASYLALLRHGLVLGFVLAPWALVPALGLWCLPAQAVAVYFLFGLELTAEELEQPFGGDAADLPLEAYCDAIRASADDILTGDKW